MWFVGGLGGKCVIHFAGTSKAQQDYSTIRCAIKVASLPSGNKVQCLGPVMRAAGPYFPRDRLCKTPPCLLQIQEIALIHTHLTLLIYLVYYISIIFP